MFKNIQFKYVALFTSNYVVITKHNLEAAISYSYSMCTYVHA